MAKNKLFWIYLLGLCYPLTIIALKITNLDVPKSAWDAVNLNCRYELEQDENLYAVKWYKDGQEFFRCYANGTIQQFRMEDIKVYHTGRSQMGSCLFELTALTPRSGGDYVCEVSLEWPTFQTVRAIAHLDIIEPSRIVQPEGTKEIPTVSEKTSAGPFNKSSALTVIIIFYVTYYFY